MSMGVIYLTEQKLSDPAVLESVRPMSSPAGLRVLGYYVIRTDISGGIGALDGFPVTGYETSRVPGYRFAGAPQSVAIVVGIEAERTGAFCIPGFILRYRVGSTRYEAAFRNGVSISTSRDLTPSC
jgi:hypothetical protein